MAEKCEPKQNDCTKAGTGPYCQESKYGGPAKAFCLQHVKEQCEEQRQQCIQNCVSSKVASFDQRKKASADAFAARAAQAAQQDNACRKSKAYTDLYGSDFGGQEGTSSWAWNSNGLRLLYRKISTQGDIYRVLTGKNPDRSAGRSPEEIKQLQANRPVAYWDNVTAEGALAEWRDLQRLAKEIEDKLDRICPPIHIEPDNFDDCKEAEQTNADIATCISQCWFNSLSDCDTVHCMCDQYKCQGPTIDNGPIGRPPDPPAPEPSIEIDNSTRATAITSTMSEYGLPIELLYGREFLTGNVIWMGDVNEVRGYEVKVEYDQTSGTNKSIQKLVIDNYLSFHVGLCAGPVDAVSRVWLEGDLVYDKSANSAITIESQDRLRIRVLTGEETSRVEPVEAANIGFGRVPAYRGLAGAFVENINISDLGGFPNLRFEVVKKVLDETPVQESEEYLVTEYSEIDHTHRRILAVTDEGLRVLNYDTFASVSLLDVENFIGATDLPNLLTLDGSTLTVVDPMHGDELSTLTVPTSDLSFKFRYIGPTNSGFQLLGLMQGGDVSFYRVNDMTAKAALFEEFEDVLGDVATTVTPMLMERSTITSATLKAGAYSLFLARADTDLIEVCDLMCYNTDQHDEVYPQFDLGTFQKHTIEFDTSDLTLLGTLACHRDKTLIFFVEYDGTYEIVKWHPDNGISWRTTASNLPNFGMYSPARKNVGRVFMYVDTTGQVVSLDVDTGELSVLSTGNPVPAGDQFYDDQLGAITFYDGAKYVRLYADRVAEDATTVADIIRDVASRSGMQPTDVHTADVEDYEIVGFRSGSAVTGANILLNLFQVYPTTSFTDRQAVFIKKGTATNVTVQAADLGRKMEITRQDNAHDTKSATITYDSTATDDVASQTFALPDDPYEGKTALAFTFNALLGDDYARALAELAVFAAQENDVAATLSLPPKYLAFTPTDYALINGVWRIKEMEVGWDLSTEATLFSDNPNKYNEVPDLEGTTGFERFSRDREQKACASLIATPMRGLMPNTTYAATVFFGPADIFSTWDGSATISRTDDENTNVGGTGGVTFTKDLVWGRLVTPPTPCHTPFSTQYNGTMVVKFAKPEHVDRLPVPQFESDLLTSYDACLLLVGQEYIQYLGFEVAEDGVTVTFTGLYRARHFTHLDEMTHAAGELVINWNNDGNVGEAKDYGEGFAHDFKFLMPEQPDAAARLDVQFKRDNPDAYRDPGAWGITRQDYAEGILLRTDAYELQGFPYPNYVWTPALDPPAFDVWLLRAPYDAVTFSFWRENFDFTDFTYMLSAGSIGDQFIGGEEIPGFLYAAVEWGSAGFDPTTDPIWVVLSRGSLNDEVRETIKVTQYNPGDYTARQRGLNDVYG